MARIRSIKPEFWTDPDVVAMPMEARLFFIGCWNHADDFGVLKDDPERLRLQIMPADPIDATAIVDELVERRHLVRMTAPDGTAVLVVRTFCVHQKIDRRATGRWGVPDDFTPHVSRPAPPVPHQSPPLPTTPTPGGEGKGRDRNGGEERDVERDPPPEVAVVAAPVPAAPAGDIRAVFEAWQEATGHDRSVLDEPRKRLIRNAVKVHGLDKTLAAVRGVRWSPWHLGDNDRGKRYDSLALILRDADHVEEFARYELDPASRPAAKRKAGKATTFDRSKDNILAAVAKINGGSFIETSAS